MITRLTGALALSIVASATWSSVMPAHADSLFGNFIIENGTNVSPSSGGQVTFSLNADGTIAAKLTTTDGVIQGFGFDSVGVGLSQSNFVPTAFSVMWAFTDYGNYNSGFEANLCCFSSSETWTIGTPGEFSSVFQALGGGNASYDFFLLASTNPFVGSDEWAANATATPLPATLPLFATGLGGLGLLGWRRKRKAQAVAS